MSTPRKTGIPKDWAKKISDDRVANKQHYRKKNVLPGTAELQPRGNTPASYSQMGEGRHYKNVFLTEDGKKPQSKAIINKKTGESLTHQQARAKKNLELDDYWTSYMENAWPNWPAANKKKPVSGHWKPGH